MRAGAPKTGDAPTRPSRVEPLLAARGFFGMVIYHYLIQELFGGRRYQKFDHRRVSATLTQIWFDGMVAASG